MKFDRVQRTDLYGISRPIIITAIEGVLNSQHHQAASAISELGKDAMLTSRLEYRKCRLLSRFMDKLGGYPLLACFSDWRRGRTREELQRAFISRGLHQQLVPFPDPHGKGQIHLDIDRFLDWCGGRGNQPKYVIFTNRPLGSRIRKRAVLVSMPDGLTPKNLYDAQAILGG